MLFRRNNKYRKPAKFRPPFFFWFLAIALLLVVYAVDKQRAHIIPSKENLLEFGGIKLHGPEEAADLIRRSCAGEPTGVQVTEEQCASLQEP